MYHSFIDNRLGQEFTITFLSLLNTYLFFEGINRRDMDWFDFVIQ